MNILHPTPEEMTSALLEAAEAERWNHWRHELEAHAVDWVKSGDVRHPLRAQEFAEIPEAMAQYTFVKLCVYGYYDKTVWGFYARKLPFREWTLTNVLVVYDPLAMEVIHCMRPKHKKRYCERRGEQTNLFVAVRW